MWDRIRRSIDDGHARRIGHGISIAWERDLVGLLAQMARDRVLVEINLTSNESILGVRDDAHPFQLYRRAGVPVCLTTDDEGVSRSNLTMEYVKAVQRYDLDYDDIKTISRDCLAHSFLPEELKGKRLAMLETAFARFEESLRRGTGRRSTQGSVSGDSDEPGRKPDTDVAQLRGGDRAVPHRGALAEIALATRAGRSSSHGRSPDP